jgi:hypothetical protein
MSSLPFVISVLRCQRNIFVHACKNPVKPSSPYGSYSNLMEFFCEYLCIKPILFVISPSITSLYVIVSGVKIYGNITKY